MDIETILIIAGASLIGLIVLSCVICAICIVRRGYCLPPDTFEQTIEKAKLKKKSPKKKQPTPPANTDLHCKYCPVPPDSPTASINISPEPAPSSEDPDAIVPLAPDAPFNPTYASTSGTPFNNLVNVVSVLQDEVEELRFSRDLFIKKIAKLEKTIKQSSGANRFN